MSAPPTTAAFAFKRVPEGYLFAPWVALEGTALGGRFGRCYLVNEAQKAELAAIIVRLCTINRAICLCYAGIAAIFAVLALSVWIAPWKVPQSSVLSSVSPIAVLAISGIAIFTPFALAFGWYGLALRRALAGAQRTTQRIAANEVFEAEVTHLSTGRLRLQIFAGAAVALVAGYQIAEGLIYDKLASKAPWFICLPLGAYLALHYLSVLKAKRNKA